MSSPQGARRRGVLLMAGDDRFSEVVRQELRRRGIRFAEIDPGRVEGTVVPTLVVEGACAAGDLTYEGFGRIRREFLARHDATCGDAAHPDATLDDTAPDRARVTPVRAGRA